MKLNEEIEMSGLTAVGALDRGDDGNAIVATDMPYGSFAMVTGGASDGHIVYRVGAKAFVDLTHLGCGMYWEGPSFMVEPLPANSVITISLT